MRLPQYTTQTQAEYTPLPYRDPEAGAAQWGAMARAGKAVGEAVGNVADSVIKVQEERRRAADLVEAVTLRTELAQDIADLDIRLRQNYDENTHPTELAKQGKALLEARAAKASNPRVREKIMLEGARDLGERSIHAQYDADKYRLHKGAATLTTMTDTMAHEAANARDDFAREHVIQEVDRAIDAGAKSRFITPEEAVARKKKFREDVLSVIARRKIAADPEGALAELEGKTGPAISTGPAVDDLVARFERKPGETVDEFMKRRIKDVDPARDLERGPARAPAKKPGESLEDYFERITTIDPSMLEKLQAGGGAFSGLSEGRRQTLIEQAERAVQSKYQREQREEDKARKATEAAAKKAAGVFAQRALKSYDPLAPAEGKLTDEEIEQGLEEHAEYLTYDVGKSIRAMRERPYREGGTTNPDLYHALRIRILSKDPTATADSVIRHARPGGGLSAKDAEDLLKSIRQTEDEKDVTQRPLYKEGARHITILLTGITPDVAAGALLGPLGAAMKPEAARRYSDVLFAFTAEARRREQKGESLADLPAIGRKMALDALGGEAKPQQPGGKPAPPQQPGVSAPASGAAKPKPAAKPPNYTTTAP